MDISVLADTVTVVAAQTLGFAKTVLRHDLLGSNSHISLTTDSSSYSEQSPSAGVLQISALMFPIDAVAPPPVRPNSLRTAPRTMIRKKRRTRKRSSTGDSEDGEDDGFFGDGGDDDGPFGGGGGGGDGRGWNFGGYGGNNWDESSSSSSSDPAVNFMHEVICWIALSNCVHFAFKKVLRIVSADGIADSREKGPIRLTSIC